MYVLYSGKICNNGFGIRPAQYVVLLVMAVVRVTIYFTNKNVIDFSKKTHLIKLDIWRLFF